MYSKTFDFMLKGILQVRGLNESMHRKIM